MTYLFEYNSEEVTEGFAEWCADAGYELETAEQYVAMRKAFVAGMNLVEYLIDNDPTFLTVRKEYFASLTVRQNSDTLESNTEGTR